MQVLLRLLQEPGVQRTGAEPEVQAGELPGLLREQVPERVREQVLRLPSSVYRN